jgi:hypothetical protein
MPASRHSQHVTAAKIPLKHSNTPRFPIECRHPWNPPYVHFLEKCGLMNYFFYTSNTCSCFGCNTTQNKSPVFYRLSELSVSDFFNAFGNLLQQPHALAYDRSASAQCSSICTAFQLVLLPITLEIY